MLRIALSFLTAAALTYTVSSGLQTLFTLAALETAGATIPASLWLQTLWHDLYGRTFLGAFPLSGLIFIGFLVAFPTAALIAKYVGLPCRLLYPLAGATAMATLHYGAAHTLYDLNLMVGTRGFWGFSAFVMSGALGGMTFLQLWSWMTRQAAKRG